MRTLPPLLLLLSACTSRESLLLDLDAVLPAWDHRHLTVPLESATADCTTDDLALIVDALICHRDQDHPDHCDPSDDACYAELSETCAADLPDVSAPCLATYHASLADDDLSQTARADEVAIHPDDCTASQVGAQLSDAAYITNDREALAAALPAGYALAGAPDTFAGTTSGGFAFLATGPGYSCHVVFKGSDSTTDLIDDLKSTSLTSCALTDELTLGSCGSGFLNQYHSLQDQQLVQRVRSLYESASGCLGSLVVTGHSLGGALTSLLIGELHATDPGVYNAATLTAYTYGEPRTFDRDTAEELQAAARKIRWTDWGDPVPGLVTGTAGHFGEAREIYVSWSGKLTYYREPEDFAPYGSWPLNHKIGTYIERLADCR